MIKRSRRQVVYNHTCTYIYIHTYMYVRTYVHKYIHTYAYNVKRSLISCSFENSFVINQRTMRERLRIGQISLAEHQRSSNLGRGTGWFTLAAGTPSACGDWTCGGKREGIQKERKR